LLIKQEIRANAHETRESLFAGCLGLSLSISLQFTLLQRKIAKKSLKPPILGFKVIDVNIPKKLVASAGKQHASLICNYFACGSM